MKFYSMNFNIHNLDSNIVRLACTIQLRVLLVALKYSDEKFTSEKVASELKQNISDIEEAFEFWTNLGIVQPNENEKINLDINKVIDEEPTFEQIRNDYLTDRLKSDREIKDFLDEIESIVCRPLSSMDVSLILSLKDREGIPYDVILMIVQYCAKSGKASTRYIERIGLDWAKNGIDSVEKAEQKIKRLNDSKKLWSRFEKIIGISSRAPTSREEEAINRWFTEWNYDETMIKEAYERCINSKGRYILSYMDGIIKKWNQNNVRTVSDAKRSSKRFQPIRTSYSLEEFQALTI